MVTEYVCTRVGGTFFTARIKSSLVSSYRLALWMNVSFFPISGSLGRIPNHHNHLFPILYCHFFCEDSGSPRRFEFHGAPSPFPGLAGLCRLIPLKCHNGITSGS